MKNQQLSLFNNRIEDFGERIEGAAKFKRIYRAGDIDLLDDNSVDSIKKQNIWNPDWKKLSAQLTPLSYGVYKVIYRAIKNPIKLNKDNPQRLINTKAFVVYVDKLKEATELFIQNMSLLYLINDEFQAIHSRIEEELFNQFGVDYNPHFRIDRGKYTHLNGLDFIHDALSIINQDLGQGALVKTIDSLTFAISKDDYEVVLTNNNFSFIYYKPLNLNLTLHTSLIDVEFITFNLCSVNIVCRAFTTNKPSMEERRLEMVDAIKVRYYPDSLFSNVNKPKKTSYIPIGIANIERIGPDWRSRDVNEEDFMKCFNVRGGQFGNSMSQEERRNTLNYAYDALNDLADILGIEPESISFNGKLAIAFGARGHGNALAHYEPKQEVINLTKMKGCGALSHEWMHALDHYLGQKLALADDLLSKSYSHVIAMNNLLTTLKFNETNFTEYYQASARAERKYKGYWSTNEELVARAFACYIHDKLQEKGRKNDYLCYTAYDPQIPTLSCCTQKEKEAIFNAFDELFKMIKEKEILKEKES